MNPAAAFHYWFVGVYALGILAFLVMVVRAYAHYDAVEKQRGPLPSPGILIPLGIPVVILLTRIGEIGGYGGRPLRFVGLALSLYFLGMMPWVLLTMGRFLMPGIAVYRDHRLVTSGPYRFLRHPLYSAVIALWLGAALGTMNWLLMVLWPIFLSSVILIPMRQEEEIVRQKFGAEYDAYAEHTARLVPGVW